MRKLLVVVFLSGAFWAPVQARSPMPPDRGGMRRGAPEPLTLVGLAVGASAIGIARWRSKRKGKG